MSPVVSILIAAYNAERWIEQTLCSALDQIWSDKEIIVVDDGSTDSTLAIARRFSSCSLKVISQPNQGASSARNAALAQAQGNYIQWLDADDLLAPDKIEKQMDVALRIKDQKILLSSAWGHFYHRPERAAFRPTALWNDRDPAEWLLLKIEQNLQMPNFSWLVSRELTETAGPWDPRLSLDDDGEYFCRVLLGSRRIQFVPEARGFYRRSSGISQSQISQQKLPSQLASLKLYIQRLTSLEDSSRTRNAGVTLLQRWLVHFYPERMDLVREMRGIAAELGGRLEVPTLPWKYRWIRWLFGWRVAKNSQARYTRFKSSMFRLLEKSLPALGDARTILLGSFLLAHAATAR